MRTRKICSSLILILFFTIFLMGYTERQASASSVALPDKYYFVFNGQQRQAGTEYEMKSPELLVNVTSGTWEPNATVQWVSSEPGVVTVEATPYGSNFIKLVRQGPGYSTITAVIKQGDYSYSLSCLIKVNLFVDHQKTGTITATTTNERILVINDIGQIKQIFLKYVDYTPDGQTETVTGSAVSSSQVTWESDNEGVATIDADGKVTGIGGGSATITATTSTMSSQDRSLNVTLKVIVTPKYSITYDDVAGNHHTVHSAINNNLATVAPDVPSDFVINSNATIASNLKWVVYDCSNGLPLTAGTSSKMTYTVSPISGNVSFTNVMAGTYEVYAFADSKYNQNANAPYAYLKIIVPIDVGDKNIFMTVGDTYSIKDNSNIPSVGIFEYYYETGNANIARLDQTTGIVTARAKGNVTLRLVYKTAQNLYDNASVIVDDIYLHITVIDGIALSTTSATIYTKGKLLLNAIVTDPTQPVVWSSTDPGIATVVDGLVTGIRAGTTFITVKQTINGIVKKATCEITVQQSVASVTLDPDKVFLAIGEYKTLHATISPNNLSNVVLQWRSSNDKIVKIVETNALTASIQGVAGGTAVISAINQDNVVVGYCHVTVKQPVTSIVLSETDITVELASKRVQLRATVYPDNAANQKVIWSTTDQSVAKVDQNGLITLVKPGIANIFATSDDNPAIKAMCKITIRIPVVSVGLDETSKTMYVGEAARLSYVVLPTNASNNSVVWYSTNSKVATVDNTGKVSAKAVGSTVIVLKSIDGSFTQYCTITVKQIATGVQFDVKDLKLKTGESYQIITTLTPKDSTDSELTWESSDTKVAVVEGNGKVVARGAGKAIIFARTPAGGVTYCNVTVTQPVNGLVLNYTDYTLYIGKTFKLTVSVNPSGATNPDVTWKSSNTKVATVAADGTVTGIEGGMTVITCTTTDGGFSSICVVTVKEAVTSISLNYENYNLGIDKSVTLAATVSNEAATNQNVTWTSSNERIAIVNQKGKVTGVSIGYATITATTQDGSEAEASCEIRVVRPVTSIVLDNGYLSMLVGENKALKATVRPSNATFKKPAWTSSDESVAIVDEDGVVTALKAGNAIITAAAKDNSGKKAMSYISVRERVPSTGITVMDKKLVMVSGENKIVQIALNPVASTDKFYWSSDNSAVARVDKNTGKIIAGATGTANVTVMTDSGKTANVEVTVIGLNITELTLEQYTTYSYPLSVEGATSPVKWSIDHPEIAVVNNGVVSSRAVGKATITATVNGRSLTCKLTVVKIK